MPELTDDQYRALMNDKVIADLVKPLWDNPKTSPEAKRLLKVQYPEMAIPEYDLEQKFEARLAAERKEREDERAAIKAREQSETWKQQRAKAQADYGLTDDGMKDVEDFMVKNNVANYEVAAGYKAAKNPRASTPTSAYDAQYWNFGKSDRLKEISQDPEGYARKEFISAIERDTAKRRAQAF